MKARSPEPAVLGEKFLAEGIVRPVRRVFSQARELGAPAVHAVIIEDTQGRWRDLMLSLPLEVRLNSVLVFQSSSALDCAGRLSIGGAMPFPPSTLRAVDASRAADRKQKPTVRDPGALEEMTQQRWSSIRLQPEALWKKVVGLRGMLRLLQELAEALGKAPCFDGVTLMLPPDLNREEIAAAWAALETRPPWALEEMLTIDGTPDCRDQNSAKGRLARLPQGDFAGWWSIDAEASGWKLEGVQASVSDGVTPSDGNDAEILRLPSWLSLDLEVPGTPGRVLLDFWKKDQAGPRPWITNLRSDGLSAVLALGRPILVDGPIVPE